MCNLSFCSIVTTFVVAALSLASCASAGLGLNPSESIGNEETVFQSVGGILREKADVSDAEVR